MAVVPVVWGCSFSADLMLAVVVFYCCERVALMVWVFVVFWVTSVGFVWGWLAWWLCRFGFLWFGGFCRGTGVLIVLLWLVLLWF